MINILIVEDDLLIAEMLKEMLIELGYNVIAVAKNFNEATQKLKEYSEINLTFLDINLNGNLTGIDVAKHINLNYQIPFIFLTSFSGPKTVKDAADEIPDAYLLKPFTKNDLFSTLEMFKARNSELVNHSIVVKVGTTNVKLSSDIILYARSEKNYVEIITKPKRLVVRTSLDTFISELDDPLFIRVHRSFAVNMNKVDKLSSQQLQGENFTVSFSRNYKEKVQALFKS